jgi:hypothetical protein
MKPVLAILLLAYAGAALAADASGGIRLEANPKWCPIGFRCLRVSEYEAMTERVIVLRRDLALANLKNRHFGLGCAVGPGLAGVVDENFRAHLLPSPLSVVCGGAIRF